MNHARADIAAESWRGFGAPRITGPGGLTRGQLDSAQSYLTQFAIYYDFFARWSDQVNRWEDAGYADRASVQQARAALTRYARSLNPLVPIVQRVATRARDDGAVDDDGRPRGSMLGYDDAPALGSLFTAEDAPESNPDTSDLGEFVAILWAVAAIIAFAAAGVFAVYLSLPEVRRFAEALPGIEREFQNTRLMVQAAEQDIGAIPAGTQPARTRGGKPPAFPRTSRQTPPLPPTVYDQQRARETEAQVRTARARADSGADFWQGTTGGLAAAGLAIAAIAFLRRRRKR